MKTLSYLTAVLTVGVSLIHAEPAGNPRSTAQVTIRADAKTVKPEREKKQDTDRKVEDQAKSETVTKTLDAELTAAKTINGPLKLVAFWVARDLTSKNQVIAKKEEMEVPLDATKTAKASVPPYAFTSLSSFSKRSAKGKMEKVDATGQTYAGWVIRVYEGTTLVGEAASTPPLLKLQE